MYRHSAVDIDLEALRANVRVLRGFNGRNYFCPMVKANAYGHGDVMIARALATEGVDAVGVALVEEGIRLRDAGIRIPILVFAAFDRAAAEAVVQHGLTPVIGRPDHLAAFAGLACDAHLQFNVGMQRLGFDPGELAGVRAGLGKIKVRGVCAHLTHGEDAADPDGPTARQIALFLEMSRDFPGVRHAHKSASLATLGARLAAGDVGARPGIGIYGLAHEGRLIGDGLKPVLSWRSKLAAIHAVPAGRGVGYGARFKAPRDARIGVVPIGYADGYSRALGGRAHVLIRGFAAPVVGTVCMDYFFVDLTALPGPGLAEPGEDVVIIGRQNESEIKAGDLAEWLGTIDYEVVTSVSTRVPRRSV